MNILNNESAINTYSWFGKSKVLNANISMLECVICSKKRFLDIKKYSIMDVNEKRRFSTMVYFDGYDINGKPCRVEEYGNDMGFVRAYERGCQAVRIASSTYVGTNGKVYASSQANCIRYTTKRDIDLAKAKMIQFGFEPEF